MNSGWDSETLSYRGFTKKGKIRISSNVNKRLNTFFLHWFRVPESPLELSFFSKFARPGRLCDVQLIFQPA